MRKNLFEPNDIRRWTQKLSLHGFPTMQVGFKARCSSKGPRQESKPLFSSQVENIDYPWSGDTILGKGAVQLGTIGMTYWQQSYDTKKQINLIKIYYKSGEQ